MLYKEQHDVVIKQGIRNRKTAPELLAMAGLQEFLDEINEEYDAEKNNGTIGGNNCTTDGVGLDKTEPNPSSGVTLGLGVAVIEERFEKLIKDQEPETVDKLKHFRNYAKTLMKTHVKFIVEPSSETDLAKQIAASAAGQVRGDASQGKYCGIVYDVRMSGETITCPNHRIPSFRNCHFKKLALSTIRSKGATEINEGDLFLVFDGGKHGNETAMLNCFSDESGNLAKEKRSVYICYTESSICERYKKQGTGAVQQEDTMLCITRNQINLNGRARKHFSGSNRGSFIGPLSFDSYKSDSVWKLSAKDKKVLYGKDNRMAVGGPSPVTNAAEDESQDVALHQKPINIIRHIK